VARGHLIEHQRARARQCVGRARVSVESADPPAARSAKMRFDAPIAARYLERSLFLDPRIDTTTSGLRSIRLERRR
jgi:hypothetical protein